MVPNTDINLTVGDTVTLEIAGLGKLVNSVISADTVHSTGSLQIQKEFVDSYYLVTSKAQNFLHGW